jgi:hypothetical protein
MEPNFNRYRAIGQRFVSGFLQPEILAVLDVVDTAQRTKQVSGAIAEIGASAPGDVVVRIRRSRGRAGAAAGGQGGLQVVSGRNGKVTGE